MKLTLLQCHPAPHRLAAWATRFGLTAGGDDPGYALHTLLTSAFGEAAPKPFRYFGDTRGLLAYTTHAPETLSLAAQVAAPDVYATLGLDRFATRDFSLTWQPGHRLGFEIRTRPILRTAQGKERDVFLAALDAHPEGGETLSREAIYAEWLRTELTRGDAAAIEHMQLEGFRLSAGLRKGASSAGKRPTRRVTGPDALFNGVLTVGDPAGFAALLARGIGRHRTFGFGMLLLKPPSSC